MCLGAFLGGASIIGSGISAGVSVQIARENRRFQERMSSSAHQREVKDLRLAGLNPILSAGMGGASTPPGNVPHIPDFGAGAHQAASTLLQEKIQKEEIANIKTDTWLKGLQGNDVSERMYLTMEQRRHQQQINVGAKLEAEIDRSSYGRWMRYINRAMPAIKTGVSAGTAIGVGRYLKGGTSRTIKPQPRNPFNRRGGDRRLRDEGSSRRRGK